MSTEHVVITDPQIHETKGVSSAAVDTILVADGVGSANWQPVTSVISDVFVKMSIVNNSTVVDTPLAVDSELHTNSDYVEWTQLFTEDVAIGGSSDPTTKRITIPITGIYGIDAWASVSSSDNESVSGYTYAVNGVPVASTRPVLKIRMKTSGDIGVISGFGLNQLSAGDEISMFVADTKGSDLTIIESVWSVRLERKT